MPVVEPTKDGPYLLSGCPAVVRMRDGAAIPLNGQVALCRCGGSANKPFCDGTRPQRGCES
ncbi:MAG: CDGSH iron-sulfur domain-containing protein [Planctomycetes bacterium]|nr:CDGSH iron-sulfur domain-containing protein [Planctomycetota bacterium]